MRNRRISEREKGQSRCIHYSALSGLIGWRFAVLLLLLLTKLDLKAQLPWKSDIRTDILLNNDWKSVADSSGTSYKGFEQSGFADTAWKIVQVPHNWDDYGGYIRDKHGNLHGDAWYRKTFKATYHVDKASFLFFEGVGSYATVYLNGQQVGTHAGGRTSFTLEVTPFLKKDGSDNLLAVKVRHPANIRDLPWVCGGCSQEVGFSEGSQPFGIFRPVHLIQTGKVRITPFGVHIYNDTTVTSSAATLYVGTTLKNYTNNPQSVIVQQQLFDGKGQLVAEKEQKVQSETKSPMQISEKLEIQKNVRLWSLESPYLYHLKTSILEARTRRVLDELQTPYGIRWIKWPNLNAPGPKQFLLNGKPVFINGIAGYEHALGKSHAFTSEEISTRVEMIRSMGFNAFRDAHQPHNLRYQHYWDSEGVLWWPQFSAHIWFDTPAFRKNFLVLLKDWVLERRNSPSNIMWGLQNESQLPASFARQCVALIRSLDPTASGQRLITTCNGGSGTDWDVPQNWSGTYGGDPDSYGTDLKKEVLVGEYGGWRSKDLHTEGGFHENGPYSEESWCALLEKKIKWANRVKDSVCGQFLWLFNSHDNPGRVQAAEGYRDLDRIGPVNYKGLLTSWEEPTEAVYLYQSNYTDPAKTPMVHIVSHDWPDRWLSTSERKDIVVYSNCDSVILYNDIHRRSLGSRTREGVGTHFTWKQVTLKFNVLYAVGYIGGKQVVHDEIRLRNLPAAPQLAVRKIQNAAGAGAVSRRMPAAKEGYQYLYRMNCGGPAYKDQLGQIWSADRFQTAGSFGSRSWTSAFPGLPSFFASQRRIYEPIKGTNDPGLFQTFRYGRAQLKFNFPVSNGRYRVELYFAEPWWGIGNLLDCAGWRDFDVAINGQIRIPHLDIWKSAGSLKALNKAVDVDVYDGEISISFPNTYSGQAVISAIAIAAKTKGQDHLIPAKTAPGYIEPSRVEEGTWFKLMDWLDTGDSVLLQGTKSGPDNIASLYTITALPPALFGAEWLRLKNNFNRVKQLPTNTNGEKRPTETSWRINQDLQMYVALPENTAIKNKIKALGFVATKTVLSLRSQRPSENSKEVTYDVYVRQLGTSEIIHKQLWWAQGILAFKPVSDMQPPYDQKLDINFAASQAICGSKTKMVRRAGKECIFFPGGNVSGAQEARDSIAWPIVTGVADFHSFQVRYANMDEDSVHATMKLLAADGKVMAEKPVVFTKTRENKWNNCYLETPTMVNAGRYQLVLVWDTASVPLYLYSMKLK